MASYYGSFGSKWIDVALWTLAGAFIVGSGLLTIVEPREAERQVGVVERAYERAAYRGVYTDYLSVRLQDGRKVETRGRATIGQQVCVGIAVGLLTQHVNATRLPAEDCR